MKKLTQEQIIVRFLAARCGQWIESHKLEKADLDGYWIGTRGTRTARGLAEKGKYKDPETGTTYFIEVRRVGKYAEYRVTGFVGKPKQVIEFLPDGKVRETYV
jgi:hypothetical protein